jgi:hypothetical protein
MAGAAQCSTPNRQKADECGEQARLALSPEEKASCLNIADEWEKIADKLAAVETDDRSGEISN